MNEFLRRILSLIGGVVCIIIGVATLGFLPLAIILFIIGIPLTYAGLHGVYNVLRGRAVNANEEHWSSPDYSVWTSEFESKIENYTENDYSVHAYLKGNTIIVEATLTDSSQEWRENKARKAYREVAQECPCPSKLYIYN